VQDQLAAARSRPGLTEALAAHDSLFGALDRAYALQPTRATLHAELIAAPVPVTHALDLPRNTDVIWMVSRTDSARAGRPVEVTHTWLRTDIFRLVVDFAA
jgi:GntR family transcriptional regulator